MSFYWGLLSPRGQAILRQVGLRVAANFSHAEVADMLEGTRNQELGGNKELEGLNPPARVTEGWVSARLRELRKELEGLRIPE